MELDTIVAPATPLGRGALAIVRIDGPLSAPILERLGGVTPEARIATLVRLTHAGEILDECIAIRYAAPHSFTGNDLVELTLHGSPLLVERIIGAVVGAGARIALPGEFTERAVLNGKLDLVQAESIADLINSRTAAQAKLSLGNLAGVLSRRATAIRNALLHVISRLEATLDFSEEGYEFIGREAAGEELRSALRELHELGDTLRRGRATSVGLSAVILGRPNAGKSTLLNRLVGSERAIVTPVPGTTRDIVRETVEIGGLPVILADTAGLRSDAELVERIGIDRAREAAGTADIIIYVVDASEGLTAEDSQELIRLPHPIVIYSKTDLAVAPSGEFGLSVHADDGVGELFRLLDGLVRSEFVADEGSLVNARQGDAVRRSIEAISAAAGALKEGMDESVVLAELYRATASLGSLTGTISTSDIYTEIFSKFCIGK